MRRIQLERGLRLIVELEHMRAHRLDVRELELAGRRGIELCPRGREVAHRRRACCAQLIERRDGDRVVAAPRGTTPEPTEGLERAAGADHPVRALGPCGEVIRETTVGRDVDRGAHRPCTKVRCDPTEQRALARRSLERQLRNRSPMCRGLESADAEQSDLGNRVAGYAFHVLQHIRNKTESAVRQYDSQDVLARRADHAIGPPAAEGSDRIGDHAADTDERARREPASIASLRSCSRSPSTD